MRALLGFLAGLTFLLVITGAIAGTFMVLYSGVVWLDMPDIAHGVLGIVAVIVSVLAGAAVAKLGDRLINRTVIRRAP